MAEQKSLLSYHVKLAKILPQIKASVYSIMFSSTKIQEPFDGVILGIFVGFFASQPGLVISNDIINQFVSIYYNHSITKENIDILLDELSSSYSQLFSDISKQTDNIKQLNDNKYIDINTQINIHKDSNHKFSDINNQDESFCLFDLVDDKSNSKVINKESGDQKAKENKRNQIIKQNEIAKSLDKCGVCSKNFENNALNYTLDCGCGIHFNCLDKYIETNLKTNKIPLQCPSCLSNIHSSFVYESLIQTNPFLVPLYEKKILDYYSLNKINDVNCCPTPGCNYIFCFENKNNLLDCPMCQKAYCLFCQSNWHNGIDCEDNILMKNLKPISFKKGSRYKICPKCSCWIENAINANPINCKCGETFCNVCGKQYLNNHCCVGYIKWNSFENNINQISNIKRRRSSNKVLSEIYDK